MRPIQVQHHAESQIDRGGNGPVGVLVWHQVQLKGLHPGAAQENKQPKSGPRQEKIRAATSEQPDP